MAAQVALKRQEEAGVDNQNQNLVGLFGKFIFHIVRYLVVKLFFGVVKLAGFM